MFGNQDKPMGHSSGSAGKARQASRSRVINEHCLTFFLNISTFWYFEVCDLRARNRGLFS
jgi:uncharacterized protein YneR